MTGPTSSRGEQHGSDVSLRAVGTKVWAGSDLEMGVAVKPVHELLHSFDVPLYRNYVAPPTLLPSMEVWRSSHSRCFAHHRASRVRRVGGCHSMLRVYVRVRVCLFVSLCFCLSACLRVCVSVAVWLRVWLRVCMCRCDDGSELRRRVHGRG